MPSGWTNECEEIILHSDDTVTTKTKDEVIHAEANAIIKLARDGESGNGSTLFCTHAPCVQCAKLIHGAGISKVYYRNSYRDTNGLEFLEKCNIEIEQT
jgi:dCMP deaminase